MSEDTREVKGVRFPEADVRHAGDPASKTRDERLYWPKDKPRPTKFLSRRPAVPCPNCDRLLTDEGGQAVVCDRGRTKIKAYLTCRCCRHQFPMACGDA